MRVLWLMNLPPFPTRSGLQRYSLDAARSLARAGATVRVISLDPDGLAGAAEPADRPDDLEFQPVPGRIRPRPLSLASPLPAMSFFAATSAFRKALSDALASDWDAVVLDHLQTGWAAPLVRRQRPSAVLCFLTHNFETRVRAEVAADRAASLPTRLGLRLDAAKVARLERRTAELADLVTGITGDDLREFERLRPGVPTLELTPGYTGERVASRELTGDVPRRVVIVGNLAWHVKRANLERFLDAAGATLHDAGVELHVLGGDAPAPWAAELQRRHPAAVVRGHVDDLRAELASARFGLVAEPMGGGFKMKTLDYVFHRVPLAVLQGSIAGLPIAPGDDHLQAPDERALGRAIVEHVDDLDALNRWQERAFERCAGAFDWDERGRRLHDALEERRAARR